MLGKISVEYALNDKKSSIAHTCRLACSLAYLLGRLLACLFAQLIACFLKKMNKAFKHHFYASINQS